MSDLISRSVLKEEIESLTVSVTGLRAGKSILSEYAKQYKESLLRIIDEQPTAYDVEKVVEQLEDYRAKFDCKLCRRFFDGKKSCEYDCNDELINTLIDIVRGGRE